MQSDLDGDVFMRLPQSCSRLSGIIVKLNKSLYGLKQASRQSHARLTRRSLFWGCLQCLADVCVFRLMDERRVMVIIVVYVNCSFCCRINGEV